MADGRCNACDECEGHQNILPISHHHQHEATLLRTTRVVAAACDVDDEPSIHCSFGLEQRQRKQDAAEGADRQKASSLLQHPLSVVQAAACC